MIWLLFPIGVVRYLDSHEFLDDILSSDEFILEVMNIWLHPPKDIFMLHWEETWFNYTQV